MTGSEAQLAQLAARVDALERRAGVTLDQLTENVFSYNAAGEIEETLTGKLHSKGIVIPLGHVSVAGPFGPGVSAPTEVAWEDGSGLLLASLTGFNYTTVGLQTYTRLFMAAKGAATRKLVSVELNASQPPEAEKGEVRVNAGEVGKKLLDLTGASDFAFKGEGGTPVISIVEATHERNFGAWNVVSVGAEHPPALVIVRTEIEIPVQIHFSVREKPSSPAIELGAWVPVGTLAEQLHTFPVSAGWEWQCSVNTGAGENPELHSTYGVLT